MEPDKLSALLKGQLSQQEYLSSQQDLITHPTNDSVPEVERTSGFAAATEIEEGENDEDGESENTSGSEESGSEYEESGSDDEDDDDEDDDDEEELEDSSSEEGKENVGIVEGQNVPVVNQNDGSLKSEDSGKLGLNEFGENSLASNGGVGSEEPMDLKDSTQLKPVDEIPGEILSFARALDAELLSSVPGEDIIKSNDTDLKPPENEDGTQGDAEKEKTVDGAKKKKTKVRQKRKRPADRAEKTHEKKKRRKKDDGERKKKKERKKTNERKNIRNIFKEDELDEQTLAAQQEEVERKKRLLELQRNVQNNMHLKALLETDSPDEEDREDEDVLGDIEDKGKKIVGKYAAFKPTRDIIDISSDDDDDVMVLENQVEEVELPDDPNNSGLHVDDTLNIPDEQGRVLINVGHPGDEPDIFLAPQIARTIKPHQIGGIRFLYDNLVESVNRFQNSLGFGCILAHSMGLGKTIQVIAFIDIFLRNTTAKSVLCIVPINTLQNWLGEFAMWTPESHRVDEDKKEEVWPREFRVHLINDNHKTTKARAAVINEWQKKGGILLMGYEMYRLLATRKPTKAKRKSGRKSGTPMLIDLEEEDRNMELAMNIQTALLRPGPDLVICDEGHRIKNSHASISQALKNIRTRRRVVLTGYPLQNNLIEYWCMVDFVRPNYLGSKGEFSNMFERPIMNGQCMDSTPSDARLMRHRAHVLHSLLEGFVQRRGHSVLRTALPMKEEHVLLVRMSRVQRELYRLFMDSLEEMAMSGWATINPLKAFSVCCKIWNHPDVLYKIVKQMRATADEDDLDLGETADGKPEGAITKKPRGRKKKAANPPMPVIDPVSGRPFPDPAMGPIPDGRRDNPITYEWADDVMKTYIPGDVSNGGKMLMLFRIIEETVKLGDKLLVFSQSLYTLNLMEEFLGWTKVPNTEEKWTKNKHYFRLDGSTSSQEREKLITLFNAPDNENVHLFLLSTRAGCLGINLIGASRVVVFDASWNPCHDCQAVCRVYRYGQTKPCYIYRLVTDNTLEKRIYDRQINKQGMADRVVDEMNPQNNFSKKQVESLLHYEDKDLPTMNTDCVDDISDPVMRVVLKGSASWITKDPFTHESLLIDQQDLRLSKAEKRLARQSYEREKKMSLSGYQRPSYQAFYPKGAPNPYGRGAPRTVTLATSIPNPGASVSQRQILPTPVPMSIKPGNKPAFNKGMDLSTPGSNHSGVTVNQVITTTEIVVPATTTSTDTTPQIKIPPGKQILVIKTQKGVYIRTPEGKIFAVRGGAKTGPIPKLTSQDASSAPSAAITTTTSTLSVSTSSMDSAGGLDTRQSSSLPRASSLASFDMMDPSSQDSAPSPAAGGLSGFLRSALMKGRQEMPSQQPSQATSSGDQSSFGPMSAPPTPLTAQFSSLSTHSHQASPVPFTKDNSNSMTSPMESLVHMSTGKNQKSFSNEKDIGLINQPHHRLQQGHGVKGPDFDAYFPHGLPSPSGYSHGKYTEGMPPHTGGAMVQKGLTDPFRIPEKGKPGMGDMANMLRNGSMLTSAETDSTLDSYLGDDSLQGTDKELMDYYSGESEPESESGLYPEGDFGTNMPHFEPKLPASSQMADRVGVYKQHQMGQFQRDQYMSHGTRSPGEQYSEAARNAEFERRMKGAVHSSKSDHSLSSLLGNDRLAEYSPPPDSDSAPIPISEYQRALSQPSASYEVDTMLKNVSMPSPLGDRRLAKEMAQNQNTATTAKVSESIASPMSISDYQRALSQQPSSSYKHDAPLGPDDRLGSLMQEKGRDMAPNSKAFSGKGLESRSSQMSIAEYQKALAQPPSNKPNTTAPYDGLDRRRESAPNPKTAVLNSARSLKSPSTPMSIADYQKALAQPSAGYQSNSPASFEDYDDEDDEDSLDALEEMRREMSLNQKAISSSRSSSMSISDYQKIVAQSNSSYKPDNLRAPPGSYQQAKRPEMAPKTLSNSAIGSPMSVPENQRALNKHPSSGNRPNKLPGSEHSVSSLLGNKRSSRERGQQQANFGPMSQNVMSQPLEGASKFKESHSEPAESADSGVLSIAEYQKLLDQMTDSSKPEPKAPSGAIMDTAKSNSPAGALSIAEYRKALEQFGDEEEEEEDEEEGDSNEESLPISEYQKLVEMMEAKSSSGGKSKVQVQTDSHKATALPSLQCQSSPTVRTASARDVLAANQTRPHVSSALTKGPTNHGSLPTSAPFVSPAINRTTENRHVQNLSVPSSIAKGKVPLLSGGEGSHPSFSRSLSDSPLVGTRNIGSTMPPERVPASQIGTRPDHSGISDNISRERSNLAYTSQSYSGQRMFDSESEGESDPNENIMDFLSENSPLSKELIDTRAGGMMSAANTSSINKLTPSRNTAVPSPMDIDSASHFSDSNKSGLLRKLSQNDLISRSTDLFPGEEIMRSNELADFLTNDSISSSSSFDPRSLDNFQGHQSITSRGNNEPVDSSIMSTLGSYSNASSSVKKANSKFTHSGKSAGSSTQVVGSNYGQSSRKQTAKANTRFQGLPSPSGRHPRMPDSSGGFPGMADSSGGLQGLPNSSDLLPGMADSSGRLQRMPDSSGRLPGMSDFSGRLPGMVDSSGRLQGMDDFHGRFPGVDESSGRGTGKGDQSQRLPGFQSMVNTSGRAAEMGQFSSGLQRHNEDDLLSEMLGSNDKNIVGLENVGRQRAAQHGGSHEQSGFSGMPDMGGTNTYSSMDSRFSSFENSSANLGISGASSRHSGMNHPNYCQPQMNQLSYSQPQMRQASFSQAHVGQSYQDNQNARSMASLSGLSTQSLSSATTLPSFSSSYGQPMQQSWMGFGNDSFDVQNQNMYTGHGSPQPQGMNWGSNFPGQGTTGNVNTSLMSSSQKDK